MLTHPHHHNSSAASVRRGFTLVELLAAMLILSILAAISMSTLTNIEGNARIERTKTLVARLDQLIMEKYESYKTRSIPLRINAGTPPQNAALIRLYAIRDLMRMEMPDRWSDLQDSPGSIPGGYALPQPAAWKGMRARMPSAPTGQYESAECLYLIISSIRIGDRRAIDTLSSREFGDLDNDGALEIWDAWGQPICWLRWAPGFIHDKNQMYDPVTSQVADATNSPDPFDPLHIDPRMTDSDNTTFTFALKPLIFSAGPNKVFDINVGDSSTHYATGGKCPPSDPFYNDTSSAIGQPIGPAFSDNVTNHYLEVR